MKFTDGKDRYYENMMQEVPNFHKRDYPRQKERRNTAKFKYNFSHLNCKYCKSDKNCPHNLCPHIMQNFNDLKTDKAFLSAVENAEDCKTAQRKTLLHIKGQLKGGAI